jgi:hypothetical protein
VVSDKRCSSSGREGSEECMYCKRRDAAEGVRYIMYQKPGSQADLFTDVQALATRDSAVEHGGTI